MSTALERLKSLKVLLRPVKPVYLRILLRVGSRQFRSDLRRGVIRPSVLRRLDRGWDSKWVAGVDLLKAMVDEAQRVRGPVLECGSGLSTLLLGMIGDEYGFPVLALENHPEWHQRVVKVIDWLGIRSVTVLRRDLVDHGGFDWYAVEESDVPPDPFQVVFCDGPPGATRGGRMGLMPVLGHRLAPRCSVIMDDVGRSHEGNLLGEWAEELGAEAHTAGTIRPYGILRRSP